MSWLTEIRHQPKVFISSAGERTGAVQIYLWIVDISIIAVIVAGIASIADFAFTDGWQFERWLKKDLGIKNGKTTFGAFIACFFVLPLFLNWIRERLIERRSFLGTVLLSKNDKTQTKSYIKFCFLIALPLVLLKFAIIALIVWIFFE
jgi:hypothetical protein